MGLVGVSLAGLAAGYFFLGPKGKKHREQAKAWAIKMKGDVVEKLETAREVSEPIYREIVDTVAAEYQTGMKAGKSEIIALAQDLKKHWRAIRREAMSSAPKVAKKAKPKARSAKKAA